MFLVMDNIWKDKFLEIYGMPSHADMHTMELSRIF